MEEKIMNWLNGIMNFVLDTLIEETLGVLIGIFLFDKIKNAWIEKKYGGWHVIIRKNGEEKVDRPVSAKKAKDILEEPADKVVFLKGVASPYGIITCDLLDEGTKKEVFVQDEENKKFIIDLDKQKEDKDNNPNLGIR